MSRKTFIRFLKVFQPLGIEVDINLVLPEKPAREEQKLKTLIKYVQQYPSGWKKRLELADLLYGMGQWTEAVEEYRQVFQRQPQLIPERLKLGKVLQLMGREKEAIEIYESALLLFCNLRFSSPFPKLNQSAQATKFHIIGLIEACRNNFILAVEAFSSATSFEPNNPSHWLALGQVQQLIGNYLEALKAFETILSHYPDDIIALINTYDVLIALGNTQNYWLPKLDCVAQKTSQKTLDKKVDSTKNIWYLKAQERLNQAIALAPDNYQIIERQIEYRCRMKLVSGTEGKQTKQLLNTLLELAPNSAVACQLKAYYHQIRGELEKDKEKSSILDLTKNSFQKKLY